MSRSRVSDPLQKFKFIVAGIGLPSGAGFQKVTGLGAERGVVEYAEGGFDAVHKIPGRMKGGEIELEKGLVLGSSIFATVWQKHIGQSNFRFDMQVTQLDHSGKPANTWTCCEAWISKWSGPEFDATSDDVSVETITVQFEYMLPAGGMSL